MEFIASFVEFVLHLDVHLVEITRQYGLLTYGLLFLIIFAETGFVVTPFLPGDSLLFASGAIAALGSLNIWLVTLILVAAAIVGDTVNYWIGHIFGKKIVNHPKIPFINQEHIDKTEQFYKKHGGKTIIMARFVPIVRTFAPFVAGIGTMDYAKFIVFNVVGGAVWVSLFTFAGYFFGNMTFVKQNFHYVILAIIVLSVLPVIYEYIQAKRHPDVPGIATKKLKNIVNK